MSCFPRLPSEPLAAQPLFRNARAHCMHPWSTAGPRRALPIAPLPWRSSLPCFQARVRYGARPACALSSLVAPCTFTATARGAVTYCGASRQAGVRVAAAARTACVQMGCRWYDNSRAKIMSAAGLGGVGPWAPAAQVRANAETRQTWQPRPVQGRPAASGARQQAPQGGRGRPDAPTSMRVVGGACK